MSLNHWMTNVLLQPTQGDLPRTNFFFFGIYSVKWHANKRQITEQGTFALFWSMSITLFWQNILIYTLKNKAIEILWKRQISKKLALVRKKFVNSLEVFYCLLLISLLVCLLLASLLFHPRVLYPYTTNAASSLWRTFKSSLKMCWKFDGNKATE